VVDEGMRNEEDKVIELLFEGILEILQLELDLSFFENELGI